MGATARAERSRSRLKENRLIGQNMKRRPRVSNGRDLLMTGGRLTSLRGDRLEIGEKPASIPERPSIARISSAVNATC
jgi:hypothetical protein